MNTGYFVEGKRFGLKLAQARAYARNCAATFGRPVDILMVDHTGTAGIVSTVVPV